ncbi:MAG: hypothetical protein ACI9NT_002382 [Bacteroidia bacterium]|jgi:hypothetical protein
MTQIINERAQAGMGNPEWKPNWTMDGLNLYGEILELATGKIWLCQQAFTVQAYDALTLPEGFIKSGLGKTAHDVAFFRRPPTAEMDGPLETIEVDGRTFAHVAIPGTSDANFSLKADGLMVLEVNKHHSIMFAKGRTLEIMSFGDGLDYVPQVTEIAVGLPGMPFSSKPAERVLPDGWTVREVTLKEDLFVDVPFPAKVCFFLSGHSFQGPVNMGTPAG